MVLLNHWHSVSSANLTIIHSGITANVCLTYLYLVLGVSSLGASVISSVFSLFAIVNGIQAEEKCQHIKRDTFMINNHKHGVHRMAVKVCLGYKS